MARHLMLLPEGFDRSKLGEEYDVDDDDDFDGPVPFPTTRLYACLDGRLQFCQLSEFLDFVDDAILGSLERMHYHYPGPQLGVRRGLDIASLNDALNDPGEMFFEALGFFIARLEVPAGDGVLRYELKGYPGVLAMDEEFDAVMGYCLNNAR